MKAGYAIIGLAFLLSASRLSALNAALDINQYGHTAWKIGEGLLSSAVVSIAQTPDGYLWLGTESGLLRFDGVRTVLWRPRESAALPSTDITRLIVTRDGRLWIGTAAGLASWRDGRLVIYPELAGHLIGALLEDAKGTVWAGSISVPSARLCAIAATVQCDEYGGRLGNGVFSMFEDGGTLWVGAQTGLWRWAPGPQTRYAVQASSVNDVLRGRDGALLVAAAGGLRQLAGQAAVAYAIPGIDRLLDPQRLLLDRHRGLWIGTAGRGLVHVHEGRADLFARVDGLSGDRVNALFEDREGNVWVATNEGLDRFRESAVATISKRQGLPAEGAFSVLRARDGSVWLGTPDGLVRWQDGRSTIYRTAEGLPDNRIGTLFEDSRGRILVSSLRGIAVFDGRRFAPLLDSLFTRIVYNIVEPRPGELWINDHNQGLIHVSGGAVVQTIPWSALGRDDHANALVADPGRNGLWLGFYNGGVAFLQNGAIRASVRTDDGLGAGRVSHLRLDQDRALWAATAGGLSRIKDGRVATATTANGLPCDTVHWTLPEADRSLWLFMACGLVRIGPAELVAWINDPRHSIANTLFDSADGVKIQSTAIGFNPPAARLFDGRLWFASTSGISVLDPGRLPVNTMPPAVHIEQIVADRTAVDAAPANGRVQLPPRMRDLQIDYTATSLVAPDQMLFRYRLEGYDVDWQDVGTRRQAFYSDLAPGDYRFRVIAANNSGVWNDIGASVQLTIAPAYYQTRWFLALSLGTLVALIWSAYRLRIRVVERHQHEITALNERLMKAQEQERIRIAGELHDGVMQQMLAMTMMLGTAKRRIAADSEARPTLDKISDKLVEVGSEIRRMSHDLHPPILQEAGLSQAVRAYCEEFSASSGVPVLCGAGDGLDALSRGAALALFRIVQEALGNAVKHAQAARISVQLIRTGDTVTLSVSDDGAGFDRSSLTTSGGLGLIMMRERAGQLNGTFEFSTAPGRGTSIKVVIPFR